MDAQLKRLVTLAGAVLALLLLAILLLNRHDKKVERRAAATVRIEVDSARVKALEDSLRRARTTEAELRQSLRNTFAAVDRARAGVVIRYRDRPVVPGQPVPVPTPNTPADSTEIVVTPAFMAAHDTLRNQCALLERSCNMRGVLADSALAAKDRIIANMRIAERNQPSGLQWKYVPFVILLTAFTVKAL